MGLFRFLVDGYVDICATCGHKLAKEVQANRELRLKPKSRRQKRKEARRRKWYGDFRL